uniref:N-terminal Ras-GEF domain-containing protein n=1 Tax=Otus sunia TaxID=257818 RepID=A0A8C8B7J1_9STRI
MKCFTYKCVHDFAFCVATQGWCFRKGNHRSLSRIWLLSDFCDLLLSQICRLAEHTFSQCETRRIRTIKAGTLEKLVETLLRPFDDNDFTYISIVLSTYRAFTATKEVLELFERAITSILQTWLDQCSEDFRDPPDYLCLIKLLDYLKKNIPGSDLEKRAQNLLEEFRRQEVENNSKLPLPSACLYTSHVVELKHTAGL